MLGVNSDSLPLSEGRARERLDTTHMSTSRNRNQGDTLPFDPKLRGVSLTINRARQLRHEETDAERKLWEKLRATRLQGLKFRRQVPIGDFIADFCCREHKLIIELDGGQHAEPVEIARDERRTALLESRGYRVIRFWNNEVLTNIDGIVEAILEAVRVTSP